MVTLKCLTSLGRAIPTISPSSCWVLRLRLRRIFSWLPKCTSMDLLPSHRGQAKGIIERFNGTVLVPLAKEFPSYIGADMHREAGQKVHKITRKEIREFGISNTACLTWLLSSTPSRHMPLICYVPGTKVYERQKHYCQITGDSDL